jgi:hypothetical protein
MVRAAAWLVLGAFALGGCSHAAAPVAAVIPGPAPVGATLTKAPLAGLVDMQDIAWHDAEGGEPPVFTRQYVDDFAGVFGGVVINATWDTMQPAQGAPMDTSRIDGALASIRAYNLRNPAHPLGAKLRIYAGSSAPLWAQQIGGAPIAIQRNPGGCYPAGSNCPLTVGRFWDPAYIAAWRAFQALVAANYDAEPLIRQVAVTSCTSQTDEPFVPTADKASKANLVAAGYTDAANQTCLANATADYAAWKRTPLDFTFNTYVRMGTPGGTDPAFTVTTMTACYANLGQRCIVDNHALSEPLNPADPMVYSTMQTLGAPVNFQTQAPRGFGCEWTATIARGIQLGALSIEVWPEQKYQGFDSLAAPQIASLAALFTNPIAVPAVPNPLPANCTGFNPTS